MIVSGKNSCRLVLEKNLKIKKAYLWQEFRDQFFISALEKRNILINFVDKTTLNELVNKNHQGIILDIADYEYATLNSLIKENSFIIILDHLNDPHNFGAISRTAEAFGVDGIIIPKDRGVLVNDTVIRTSAGAILNLNVAKVTNLVRTISLLKEKGFWIIGADLEGSIFTEIDYSGKIALVIGSEDRGMSRLVKENCDFIAKIPMVGQINSLNASVAAGIMIQEAVQRRQK